jgi:hypothetical protein
LIDITKFAELVKRDHGLAVIALALPDGIAHASAASPGVLSHPVTGIPVIGVVGGCRSRKLAHLRTHPRATIVLRAGWQWAAAVGPVELAGPDGGARATHPALRTGEETAAGDRHLRRTDHVTSCGAVRRRGEESP